MLAPDQDAQLDALVAAAPPFDKDTRDFLAGLFRTVLPMAGARPRTAPRLGGPHVPPSPRDDLSAASASVDEPPAA